MSGIVRIHVDGMLLKRALHLPDDVFIQGVEVIPRGWGMIDSGLELHLRSERFTDEGEDARPLYQATITRKPGEGIDVTFKKME